MQKGLFVCMKYIAVLAISILMVGLLVSCDSGGLWLEEDEEDTSSSSSSGNSSKPTSDTSDADEEEAGTATTLTVVISRRDNGLAVPGAKFKFYSTSVAAPFGDANKEYTTNAEGEWSKTATIDYCQTMKLGRAWADGYELNVGEFNGPIAEGRICPGEPLFLGVTLKPL